MDLFSTIEFHHVAPKSLIKECTYESGETGWFGIYDIFIVPARPNQSKAYVERKIQEYKDGVARYFKM